MLDSRRIAPGPADADQMRRAVIALAGVLFAALAVIALVAAPGSLGGRVLLIGVDGVFLAGFAALGLMVTARWKREDAVRSR